MTGSPARWGAGREWSRIEGPISSDAISNGRRPVHDSDSGPPTPQEWSYQAAVSGRCTLVAVRWRVPPAAALIVVLGLTTAWAGQIAPMAGRPLTDVLAELQGMGLHLIYSSAVVRPSMIVEHEPTSIDPRAILDEVLGPLGLRADDGPGGTVLIVLAGSARANSRPTGQIVGVVVDSAGHPFESAVSVDGPGWHREVTTTRDGTFAVRSVPVGDYDVTASSAGSAPGRAAGVRVDAGATTRVQIQLRPLSVFLSEVIVTPSHFRLLQQNPESRQFLDREEVSRMPHIADDLYRAVRRLPGTASGDFSARFNVRGGVDDELLVVLDGLEVYEPFHLKDFQNVFSTIDTAAVGGVDLLTGGFPAEYGDRMSGVMDISMPTPSGPTVTSLEAGTINARIQSQGSFSHGNGGWLVSGRGWYPAATASIITEDNPVVADFYDMIAKVQRRVGSSSTLALNTLVAYDDLGFHEADDKEVQGVTARYGSYHAWLNLQTQWSADLWSQMIVSAGRLRRIRKGGIDDSAEGVASVRDRRSFDVFNLGQDWSFVSGDRHVLKWGFDLTYGEAEYNYFRTSTLGSGSNARVVTGPDGIAVGTYASDRLRVMRNLIVELGLRWDRQTWTDESQTSPRVNLAYQPSPRTTVRAAWGLFHQSQRLNELQVEDGIDTFFPAQVAEHWTASVEHVFGSGLSTRLELYRKDFDHVRPRYENLFNPIELFPEAASDRVLLSPDRGRSRGLEVVFKDDSNRRVSWWAGYTLAVTEDLIDGRWQPRSWDQRHAAVGGVNVSLAHDWNFNLSGTIHTGWPTTRLTASQIAGPDGEPVIVPIPGPRNGERFPLYRRLDVRASKLFPTSLGTITLTVEVINLTSRDNPCCVEDFDFLSNDDGSVTVIPHYRDWVPILPSFTVRWQF